MAEVQQKILYSREVAAEKLSISVRTLVRLVSKGEIRPRRIGGRTLFSLKELERFAGEDRAA